MKKHAKIVVLTVTVLSIALAGVILISSRSEPGIVGRTIPYLAGLTPTDEAETLTSYTGSRTGTFTSKMHSSVYNISEKYETVMIALKKDLKARITATSSSSVKHLNFTMFNIGKPGATGGVTINVRKISDRVTSVYIIETRSPNPIDQVKLWYAGVTGKRQGGLVVVTNSKSIP